MGKLVVALISRTVLAEAHVEIFKLDRPARGHTVFDAGAGSPTDTRLVEFGKIVGIDGGAAIKVSRSISDVGERHASFAVDQSAVEHHAGPRCRNPVSPIFDLDE